VVLRLSAAAELKFVKPSWVPFTWLPVPLKTIAIENQLKIP
jgi:hypothetical protein